MKGNLAFGQWLKERRKALGLTQAELAARASCSLDTIHKVESGRRKLSRELAEELVELLDVEPESRAAYVRLARAEAAPADPAAPDQTHAPAHRHDASSLPAQLTSLVGRSREAAAVAALLREPGVRLLTLTGPGGVGKTRLGLEVAAELADGFEDGVCFVALAPIADPALVTGEIAQTLGLAGASDLPPEQRLLDYLRPRHLLLVLDNYEHLLAAAPLVSRLLIAAPRLKALVTSRTILHLYGEHEYSVPPLAPPDPERLQDTAALSHNEAVALFVDRARAVTPSFELTEENAPAVARICRGLDGMPLAIELTAARTKLLTLQTVLSMLGSRLTLLVGGASDLPARQRTLRGAMDWSHDLLRVGERRLFARLAVFIGGFSPDAAAQVCGDPEIDVLDEIAPLLDSSLLQRVEAAGTEPRYTMLETVREYALEKLEVSGEAEKVRRRHAEHYLSLAERAHSQLAGPVQVEWLRRLRAEHDDLRAALTWSLEGNDVELGLRLAGALYRYWDTHGHLSEGRRWLEAALARSGTRPTPARARALIGAGLLAWGQGAYERAAVLYRESLALCRALGDRSCESIALNDLGLVALERGNLDGARSLFEESLALRRALGDRRGVSMSLNNLGRAAMYQGDYLLAEEYLEESLALRRELDHTAGIAVTLHTLGLLALFEGDPERGARLQEESLALRRALGDYVGIAECLEALATVAGAWGQALRAARLWGAAGALRESIGAPLPAGERSRWERHLDAIRQQLGQTAFDRAQGEGRALSPGAAVVYALCIEAYPWEVWSGGRSRLPGLVSVSPPRIEPRPNPPSIAISLGPNSNASLVSDRACPRSIALMHPTGSAILSGAKNPGSFATL